MKASWQLAAWCCVVAGPSAAFAFLLDSISAASLSCYPKLHCLRDTVDDAWAMFEHRLVVILGLCAFLLLGRLAFKPLAERNASILAAAVANALFSALSVLAVSTGMNAALHGETSSRFDLVWIGCSCLPLSFVSWRSLVVLTRRTRRGTHGSSVGSLRMRVTRDGDHPFRGIVITCFASFDHLFRGRDHLFRAS
jgi:hypothetical protein